MPVIPAISDALSRRSFSSGHFLFVLDGAPDAGYLKSIEGGSVKGQVVEEQVGPDFVHFKHLSTVEIDPIGLELGMAVSRPMFEWIRASWKRDFQRKNGSILLTDFDFRAQLELEFRDALIVETTFPSLDGSATEPAYLTVKLHPEHVELRQANGEKVRGQITPKQKLWHPSNFRLAIDGLECSHVNKVDSISVKQKIKQLYVGARRHPELEPTGLEFSNISLTMALEHARDFIDWHHEYVVKGAKDTEQEKQGYIEFLPPKGGEPLLTLHMQNLSIFNLALEKSEANADQIKRCKVELYCEEMDLDYGWGLE